MGWFLAVGYLMVFGIGWAFTALQSSPDMLTGLFRLAIVPTYALMYLFPAWLLIVLARRVVPRAVSYIAVISVTLMQVLLLTDYAIYSLYGFHINGFVINLATTPGGINSMGMDDGTQLAFAGFCVLLLLLNSGLWFISQRYQQCIFFALPWKSVLLVFLLLTVGERLTFGWAALTAHQSILAIANTLPAYQPTSIRSFGKKWLGLEMQRQPTLDVSATGSLRYPLRPLQVVAQEKPLNIVMLVSESLRADMLNSEIMPQTSAFAARSMNFSKHYSGANGTRHGVFSLFYGLPGNYWFNVLQQRVAPVLVDRIQQLNYGLYISTSAAFSYPEFDKTVFAKIPAAQLQVDNNDEGWQRDRRNVDKIEQWLASDEAKKPFFMFHFFESSHARYYFPPESVIRQNYLEDFNYAVLADLPGHIDGIFNRYINATHHLDSQIGRVLAALEKNGQLQNTLIIITGDHGEEFMEHGHWGHNSEFNDTQVRVPMVVYWPGHAPATIDYPTSHVDIPATLLPLLGVKNPASDYTVGKSLLEKQRDFLLFSDWDRIAIRGQNYKAVFPLNVGRQLTATYTTVDDRPVAGDRSAVMRELAPSMSQLMEQMTRYKNK